jgi:hypothetical protein
MLKVLSGRIPAAMTNREIARARLRNQHLVGASCDGPEEVVRRLGAVQAQDYLGAKWALGLRTRATDREVERAFAEGSILRTHVLRPTWHFVAPADIRWMLALTAPRVHALNAHYYRKTGLDRAALARCRAIFARALRGGNSLTRDELRGALERSGIPAGDSIRMGYILMHAELDGLVCSGARRGKQFTYALLEERVPPAKALDRDEALAALAHTYFSTRGPASSKDFAWWSGLSMADVRIGIASLGIDFEREVINGQTYLSPPTDAATAKRSTASAHLLPNYDEFFIGLKDRSAMAEVVRDVEERAKAVAFYAHIVVVDGQAVGGWKRIPGKKETAVELNLLSPLGRAETRAVEAAARRYAEFLGTPVGVREATPPGSSRAAMARTAPRRRVPE